MVLRGTEKKVNIFLKVILNRKEEGGSGLKGDNRNGITFLLAEENETNIQARSHKEDVVRLYDRNGIGETGRTGLFFSTLVRKEVI